MSGGLTSGDLAPLFGRTGRLSVTSQSSAGRVDCVAVSFRDVSRWLVVVPLAVALAGVAVVLTVGSLLGAALVVGGVMALGVVMIPELIERIAVWLSTGSLRRRGF